MLNRKELEQSGKLIIKIPDVEGDGVRKLYKVDRPAGGEPRYYLCVGTGRPQRFDPNFVGMYAGLAKKTPGSEVNLEA